MRPTKTKAQPAFHKSLGTPTPCEEYSCRYKVACIVSKMACPAYVHFVLTNRVTPPHGAKGAPSRVLYAQMMGDQLKGGPKK